MIRIKKRQLSQMLDQLQSEAPYEGCGILSGIDDVVMNVYPMTNGAHREDFFLMVPEEQFKVIKDIRKKGQKMLAVYHSHPTSRAYPSDKDIEMAHYEDIYYIIVSLKDGVDVRAYKIKDKQVKEEDIIVEEE